MTLLRVYSRVDEKNNLVLPRGIRKVLDIKPSDKLELTLLGMNKAKKLLVTKVKRRQGR
jgi:bifunctional DNA-binding transcriptional regulator/antitoxin component of YhaV-PrlF toxin-antitoxin module